MIITTNGKKYCFKAFWKMKSAFYGVKSEISGIWESLTQNDWFGYILGGIVFFIILIPTAIICFVKDYFETVIAFEVSKKEYKQYGTFWGKSIDFAIERLLNAKYIKKKEDTKKIMREQKKGFDKGQDYADFIKHGKKSHPKGLRKAERKYARKKRRVLNRAEHIEEEK